eukprot:gnl/TRDRNA2_/TRDRNA2_130383_c0_seq1.p1 gnl/TRDRNA2_/TRDRNA2_130383_c0~~gnl/TRDRNA2_/TRDRNA2_130383_c0_seq1.p1  ORF type:complete len:611 (-),score=86.63 gnl/TRDRNA2_/TRDRNA2_130383_c0_seq1:222-2054(-)
MVAQPPSVPLTGLDVLGDGLLRPSESDGAATNANIELVRQHLIVHLLRQVQMSPAALYATCLKLLQCGVLSREVLPELSGCGGATAAGKALPQLTGAETHALALDVVSSLQWPMNLPSRFAQEFDYIAPLGRGAFGEVWRCRHRLDRCEYAVKAVKYRANASDGGRLARRVLREAQTWASAMHPNIVRYHSAWVEAEWPERASGSEKGPSLLQLPGDAAPLLVESPKSDGDLSLRFANESAKSGAGVFSEASGDDGVIFFEASTSSSGGESAKDQPSQGGSDEPQPASRPQSLSPVMRGAPDPAAPVPPVAGTDIVCRAFPSVVPHMQGEYQATLYIQTELCSEDTLQTWIAQRNAAVASGSITRTDKTRWTREACEIFRQCCDALAHLHSKDCIHRDVKPSNILFAKDGSVRLGDFGLAKALQRQVSLEDRAAEFGDACGTMTGNVGTPSYAAPEQLDSDSYGVKSDIYALGVMLAEMLCPVQTQMERAVLIEGLRHDRRLPARAAAALPTVARLVVEMTHPDPSRRPSANDVLRAFNRDVLREVRCHYGDEAVPEAARLSLEAADVQRHRACRHQRHHRMTRRRGSWGITRRRCQQQIGVPTTSCTAP